MVAATEKTDAAETDDNPIHLTDTDLRDRTLSLAKEVSRHVAHVKAIKKLHAAFVEELVKREDYEKLQGKLPFLDTRTGEVVDLPPGVTTAPSRLGGTACVLGGETVANRAVDPFAELDDDEPISGTAHVLAEPPPSDPAYVTAANPLSPPSASYETPPHPCPDTTLCSLNCDHGCPTPEAYAEETRPDEPAKPSTAQSGNPGEATRGAAVTRAKRALGDAIDAKLDAAGVPVTEANALAVLAWLSGGGVAADNLTGASLGQLTEWAAVLEAAPVEGIRGLAGLTMKADEPAQDLSTIAGFTDAALAIAMDRNEPDEWAHKRVAGFLCGLKISVSDDRLWKSIRMGIKRNWIAALDQGRVGEDGGILNPEPAAAE